MSSATESTHDLVNIFDAMQAVEEDARLEVVRIGQDEVIVVPFCQSVKKVQVHYCQEPDIQGYVPHLGSDCILCRAGKRLETRHLLPVYQPLDRLVGVLSVSLSLRPLALWPQLAPVLKADQPMVVFIERDRDQFTVTAQELTDDMDSGEAIVEQFKAELEAGTVDLASVYPARTNDQLREVPEIANRLRLKGYK